MTAPPLDSLVDWLEAHTIVRIILIAVLAHLAVVLIDMMARSRFVRRLSGSTEKSQTVLGLLHSLAAFVIYFIALGYILRAFGVDLSAYLASASVIALAVGFGSQGVVQDVVTGITLVFADLFDVGEMVEISGQAGIIRKVGMRFTIIQNYMGALVYIPNRSITNVVNYPRGSVRLFVDVNCHDGECEKVEQAAGHALEKISRRYARLVLAAPSRKAISPEEEGRLVRFELAVWPGQNALVESVVKATLLPQLKESIPDYPDSGLTLVWEAEPIPLLPTDHKLWPRRREETRRNRSDNP